MKIFHRRLLFLGLSLTVSAAGTTFGQIASANEGKSAKVYQTRVDDTPLKIDQGVKRGKLSNGFEYYIRKNVEPQNRVVMYLATKVGSILENEEERGLAHFLEHMQFNGTKHFPKNQLVDYLQKVGVRFGADLNAYTGFDETVYQLPIPSDDPELLKQGMLVMRDWAQDALLEDSEIDKERGVILEEMLGSRGAQQRIQEKTLPYLVNQSLFAERLPIGTKEVVTGFDHQLIRDFHTRWYRPDLQALIVVGDIDVDQMEAEIKAMFSDLKTPSPLVPRTKYDIPLEGKNQFLVVTDAEMPSTVFQMLIKHPSLEIRTEGDFKKAVTRSMFNNLLSPRFSEILRESNPPFVSASGSIGSLLNNLDAFTITMTAKPGQFEEGLKAAMTEFNRVRKFGFTESELARVKTAMLTGIESSYTERNKKTSASYVEEYLNHFLRNSVPLSSENRYELQKRMVNSITLADVERVIHEYLVDVNRDIFVLGPEKEKETLPTESQILNWIAEVENTEIEAYQDDLNEEPLLASLPKAGTVVKEEKLEKISATKWTLSNGIQVVLKPTDFKNDEILIASYSPGGSSLYSDEMYISAANAANVVSGSGLGSYSPTQLSKYLSGKKVGVSPFIRETSEGINATAGKQEIKTAFELIYSYFTASRVDTGVLSSVIERTKANLANYEANPNNVFSDSVNYILYNGNIRRSNIKVEHLEQLKASYIDEVFKDRFADASDFTFVIVGSFTEDEMKPFVEQYLASLPALNRNENYKDLGIYPPRQGVEKIVQRGQEEKANVQLSLYGDYDYNDRDNMLMNALNGILKIKLTERLREAESGVYGVGSSISYSKIPTDTYSISVSFGTSPEKVRLLIDAAYDEFNKLKANGPEQVDIDKYLVEQKRLLEVSVKNNGFWLQNITGSLQLGQDPELLPEMYERLEKTLSVDAIQKIAQKYLNQDQMYRFILLPEKK